MTRDIRQGSVTSPISSIFLLTIIYILKGVDSEEADLRVSNNITSVFENADVTLFSASTSYLLASIDIMDML